MELAVGIQQVKNQVPEFAVRIRTAAARCHGDHNTDRE